MELLPSSMSFRLITTLDIADESEIPELFEGRVRRPFEDRSKYVAWYTAGLLNNPTRSYPAYRRFRSNGQVKYELHYSNGMLQDSRPSSPAVRGFFANGMIHYEERYEQGRRHDGADGGSCGAQVAIRRHPAPRAPLPPRPAPSVLTTVAQHTCV